MTMNMKRASVSEIAAQLAEDPKAGQEVEAEIRKSQLVTALTGFRLRKGISQKEIAERMPCDPSKVSKMESGNDGHLRWADVLDYVRSLGVTMSVCLEDSSLPATTRIKQHVFRIHDLLQELVEIARQLQGEGDIQEKIDHFYGEVLFNFLVRFGRGYQDLQSVIRIPAMEKPALPPAEVEVVEEGGGTEKAAERDLVDRR
jgi:transcriptional regulator with XRE-family HTH domain